MARSRKTTPYGGNADECLTLKGSGIVAEKDLYWDRLELFEDYCQRLLSSSSKRPVVDLSRIGFISSVYFACLASFIAAAVRARKRPRILVNVDILWVFDMLGKDKMVEIDVV